MRQPFPVRRAQVFATSTIVVALCLPWTSCFRDPDVTKIKCTKECPAGFACVNPDPSGPNGHCYSVGDGGTTVDAAGLAAGDGAVTSAIDASGIDTFGPDTARTEAGPAGSLDVLPIDGPFDLPLEGGTTIGSDAREAGAPDGVSGTGGAAGPDGARDTGAIGGYDAGLDVATDMPLPPPQDSGSGGVLGTGGSMGTGGATGSGGTNGDASTDSPVATAANPSACA